MPFCMNLILVGCAIDFCSMLEVLVMVDIWRRMLPTFIGDVIEESIKGEKNRVRVDLNV